jgi:hypothetical protein
MIIINIILLLTSPLPLQYLLYLILQTKEIYFFICLQICAKMCMSSQLRRERERERDREKTISVTGRAGL